jgi:hypothetical protein
VFAPLQWIAKGPDQRALHPLRIVQHVQAATALKGTKSPGLFPGLLVHIPGLSGIFIPLYGKSPFRQVY